MTQLPVSGSTFQVSSHADSLYPASTLLTGSLTYGSRLRVHG